jgi:ZIP family zinc transporter
MDVSGNVGIALILTALAGLSTGIGSTIAYFVREPKTIYLSFSLGFSAGVMVYTSFVELLPRGTQGVGQAWGLTAFFTGIIFICLIDRSIPEAKNPHRFKTPSDVAKCGADYRLLRTGLLTALAIGVHNFPEGLATFATALVNVKLGVVTAVAIAIHNIPEGISVSVPILYATGDKNKAFMYSFLSGISEPLGALAGFAVLMPFLSEGFLAFLLAFTAGIMVYLSLDELLPMAHRYGHSHAAVFGMVLGMFVIALSLFII